jgi:hypothetical protein
MEKPGCGVIFFMLIACYALTYGLCWGVYTLLYASSSAPLAMFHTNTLAFADYYTVDATGSLSTRILLFGMLNLIVLIILWGGNVLLSKIIPNAKRDSRFGTIIVWIFVGLMVYSLGVDMLVPNRKVTYDRQAREMVIEDYDPFLFLWPTPIKTNEQSIAFEDIVGFRYEDREHTVMGASHIEGDLFALTKNDTILVGDAFIYHGEFGWLTDWRSRDEIRQSAEIRANIAMSLLSTVVGLSAPPKNQ